MHQNQHQNFDVGCQIKAPAWKQHRTCCHLPSYAYRKHGEICLFKDLGWTQIAVISIETLWKTGPSHECHKAIFVFFANFRPSNCKKAQQRVTRHFTSALSDTPRLGDSLRFWLLAKLLCSAVLSAPCFRRASSLKFGSALGGELVYVDSCFLQLNFDGGKHLRHTHLHKQIIRGNKRTRVICISIFNCLLDAKRESKPAWSVSDFNFGSHSSSSLFATYVSAKTVFLWTCSKCLCAWSPGVKLATNSISCWCVHLKTASEI